MEVNMEIQFGTMNYLKRLAKQIIKIKKSSQTGICKDC